MATTQPIDPTQQAALVKNWLSGPADTGYGAGVNYSDVNSYVDKSSGQAFLPTYTYSMDGADNQIQTATGGKVFDATGVTEARDKSMLNGRTWSQVDTAGNATGETGTFSGQQNGSALGTFVQSLAFLASAYFGGQAAFGAPAGAAGGAAGAVGATEATAAAAGDAFLPGVLGAGGSEVAAGALIPGLEGYAAGAAAAGVGAPSLADSTALTNQLSPYATEASNFTNTSATFNAAKDSQLANQAIEAGAPGFEQFGGNAVDGYLNAPLQAVPNPAPPEGITDYLKDLLGLGKTLLGDGAGGGGSLMQGLQLGTQLAGALTEDEELQGEVPAIAPPQPEVGASDYYTNTAQGGMSGTLQGVAGTLLTARDKFGYGKSMVG